jgi:hypothetical protein
MSSLEGAAAFACALLGSCMSRFFAIQASKRERTVAPFYATSSIGPDHPS